MLATFSNFTFRQSLGLDAAVNNIPSISRIRGRLTRIYHFIHVINQNRGINGEKVNPFLRFS